MAQIEAIANTNEPDVNTRVEMPARIRIGRGSHTHD
jgi:hypothetical protein